MAEVNEIRLVPKSLVDVTLGALAFYCEIERGAMPITHTLATLSVYMWAWVVVALLAVYTPWLIGGSSVSERFGELAPVLVLSSPALWRALRFVGIYMEMFDTWVGIATRTHETLSKLKGIWGETQGLQRSYVLHACLRTKYASSNGTDDNICNVEKDIRVSKRTKDKASVAAPHLFVDGREPVLGGQGDKCVDCVSMRWMTEVLPQAASVGLAPRHRSVVFQVEELLEQAFPPMCGDKPELTATGIVGRWRFAWRRFSMFGRLVASRTPFEAELGNYTVRIDNVDRRWVTKEEARVRRALLTWAATLVQLLQRLIGALLVSVDVVIGELGALVLLLCLERVHPLPARRNFVREAIRGKAVIVGDVIRRREVHRTMAKDHYLTCASGVSFMQTIAATLGGHSDLLHMAVVMLTVGWTWNVNPREESDDIAKDYWRLFGSEEERKDVLPRLSSASICMLPADVSSYVAGFVPGQQQGQVSVASADRSSVARASHAVRRKASSCMAEKITTGVEPMVVVTAGVFNVAKRRGYCSGRFSGLDFTDDDSLQAAAKTAADDFAKNWLVNLLKFEKQNWFEPMESEIDRKFLKEMMKIAMDCHALLSAHLSFRSRAWSTTPRVNSLRHSRNLDSLVSQIDHVEQHDLLASCHRRVIAAAAWIFLDNWKKNDHFPWQCWCLHEAISLADAVWRIE